MEYSIVRKLPMRPTMKQLILLDELDPPTVRRPELTKRLAETMNKYPELVVGPR